MFDFTHCSGNDNNANNFTLGTAIEDMKILLAWATKRGFKHIGFFAEGLGALPPILLGNKYIDFIVMAYPVILIEDAYNPETISTQERDMSANLIKKLPDINIDKALEHAQKHNAKLRICEACNVYGSHAHPEGFVAFLDDEAAGTEIEFMQVYTEEELKKYKVTGV